MVNACDEISNLVGDEPPTPLPEDITDIIAIVHRERYNWHGDLHMRRVRWGKEKAKLMSATNQEVRKYINEIVEEKIKDHNKRFAIRVTDLIDLDQKRGSRPIKGRGTYKKWVPSAVLRVTYGRGRVKTKRKIVKRRNVFATSLRGAADHNEAGYSLEPDSKKIHA